MLRKGWDDVAELTFTNCFRKSGISQRDAEKAINEDEDPFKNLTSSEVAEDAIPTLDVELSNLKRKFPDHIDPTILTEDFIDFDIEFRTSLGVKQMQLMSIKRPVHGCVGFVEVHHI